jgi:hypothetical protein
MGVEHSIRKVTSVRRVWVAAAHLSRTHSSAAANAAAASPMRSSERDRLLQSHAQPRHVRSQTLSLRAQGPRCALETSGISVEPNTSAAQGVDAGCAGCAPVQRCGVGLSRGDSALEQLGGGRVVASRERRVAQRLHPFPHVWKVRPGGGVHSETSETQGWTQARTMRRWTPRQWAHSTARRVPPSRQPAPGLFHHAAPPAWPMRTTEHR